MNLLLFKEVFCSLKSLVHITLPRPDNLFDVIFLTIKCLKKAPFTNGNY